MCVGSNSPSLCPVYNVDVTCCSRDATFTSSVLLSESLLGRGKASDLVIDNVAFTVKELQLPIKALSQRKSRDGNVQSAKKWWIIQTLQYIMYQLHVCKPNSSTVKNKGSKPL
ncbi:hypothetical protein VNO80_10450 [Phaseolus coccineus]|uniref:Uncharacterized protein n=1 Tax=Phaseolus coccineus TaxID=3886 RepID=A0AAN9N8F1_PHACN